MFKDMFFHKLQGHGNLPLYGFVNPWLILLARLSQGRRKSGKNFRHHLVPNNLYSRVNWVSDEQRCVVDF